MRTLRGCSGSGTVTAEVGKATCPVCEQLVDVVLSCLDTHPRRERIGCWSLIDRHIVDFLRKRGWDVQRTKSQPIVEGVVMTLKARKGRWLVLAPDTARLWDIADELDAAGEKTLHQHRRYMAARFDRSFPASITPASPGADE